MHSLKKKFGKDSMLLNNIFPIELIDIKEDRWTGIDEIFNKIYYIFKDDILTEKNLEGIDKTNNKDVFEVFKKSKFFCQYNKYNDLFKSCSRKGVAIVAASSLISLAIDAFPLPLSEAVLLYPLEFTMISSIASLYGMKLGYEEAKEYIKFF